MNDKVHAKWINPWSLGIQVGCNQIYFFLQCLIYGLTIVHIARTFIPERWDEGRPQEARTRPVQGGNGMSCRNQSGPTRPEDHKPNCPTRTAFAKLPGVTAFCTCPKVLQQGKYYFAWTPTWEGPPRYEYPAAL